MVAVTALFQGTIILFILHAPQNSFNDKQKNDSFDSLNNILEKLVEKYIRVTVGPPLIMFKVLPKTLRTTNMEVIAVELCIS